ncbi:MAG: general secretion pathway protein GspB [Candidatus Omnitrophota bacterium]
MRKITLALTILLSLFLLFPGSHARAEFEPARPPDIEANFANGTIAPERNPFIPQLPSPTETQISEAKPKPTDIKPPQPQQPRPASSAKKIEEVEIKLPSLTISGLVWNSDRPQAIINDQVIDIGMSIENATITKISKAGIVVEYSGKEFTVQYTQ